MKVGAGYRIQFVAFVFDSEGAIKVDILQPRFKLAATKKRRRLKLYGSCGCCHETSLCFALSQLINTATFYLNYRPVSFKLMYYRKFSTHRVEEITAMATTPSTCDKDYTQSILSADNIYNPIPWTPFRAS